MASADIAVPLEDGPWDGMLDARSPTAYRPGKYLLGQNVYPLDPAIGTGVVGRPGLRQLGSRIANARVQALYQFENAHMQIRLPIAVCGGEVYAWDVTVPDWAKLLSTAQLALSAITLSAVAPVVTITRMKHPTLGWGMVLSDGINTPFFWNGANGGTVVKLVNCPVLYGQPWIYEARFMAIKASAAGGPSATFVWSEVEDPENGYDTGTFSNAWELATTDASSLYSGVATNQGIIIRRRRSATFITGGVTADFATSNNRDSLDEEVGTASPYLGLFNGLDLIGLDADLHPQLLRSGGSGFEAIWQPLRETLQALPKTDAALEGALGVLWPAASLALLAVRDAGQTENTLLLVFDVKSNTPVPVGVWRGWEVTALAVLRGVEVINGSSLLHLCHGDSHGYVYMHGNPDDALWDDALQSGTVAISHVLETQALGYTVKSEKVFDRLDLNVRCPTQQSLSITCTTPKGVGAAQAIVAPSSVAGAEETHVDVGLDERGRWIRAKITHATLGEQFGLAALLVSGYASSDDPEIP